MTQPSAFSLQPSAITRKGFTLIELLVVITLIGILTTIGLLVYQGATKKARDGKRSSDLEQIRTALELYRSDSANNTYPATSGATDTVLMGELAPDYIRTLPADPKKDTYTYYYWRILDGNDDARSYDLCAHWETLEDVVGEEDYCDGDSNCGGKCNYRVQNP